MKHPPGPPPRLVELSPAEDPTGAVACVLAATETPFDIAPTARRQIRARLRQAMTAGSRSPVARTRFALAAAILLLLCGGVVGATVGPMVSSWIFHRRSPAPDEASPAMTASHHRRSATAARLAPPAPPLPAAPEPAPAPTEAAAPPPVLRLPAASRSLALRATRSPRTTAPGASDAPPAVETESELLATAIHELRVAGDASAALHSLEQQSIRYPRGAFALEGAALRVEALLKLGRRDDALRELDRLPVDSLPRGAEWHTVRGELRAESGRWREAEADFDGVLGERPLQASANQTARALWGRAVSRARAGNQPGARADYTEYLRRFPNGRFAREAARAIGRP